MSIERDIEKRRARARCSASTRRSSPDHHLIEFITDYLRMMVSGNLNAFEIENLMDNEIETHHHEAEVPSHCVTKIGDGLPAFGIVAAVMGVVHTMESVGAPPSELGMLIAHALVGTFLGILLAYGFAAPLASILGQTAAESTKIFQTVKVTLLASLNGYPPATAVEFGRKVLFSTERPSFQELEDHVKQAAKAAKLSRRTDRERDMPDGGEKQVIHVKRIKKVAGGHHGGAWKIAYADFVTAMMAFFLLMWLLGSTAKGDLKGISEYFQTPLKVALSGGSRQRRQLAHHQGRRQGPDALDRPGQGRRARRQADRRRHQGRRGRTRAPREGIPEGPASRRVEALINNDAQARAVPQPAAARRDERGAAHPDRRREEPADVRQRQLAAEAVREGHPARAVEDAERRRPAHRPRGPHRRGRVRVRRQELQQLGAVGRPRQRDASRTRRRRPRGQQDHPRRRPRLGGAREARGAARPRQSPRDDRRAEQGDAGPDRPRRRRSRGDGVSPAVDRAIESGAMPPKAEAASAGAKPGEAIAEGRPVGEAVATAKPVGEAVASAKP